MRKAYGWYQTLYDVIEHTQGYNEKMIMDEHFTWFLNRLHFLVDKGKVEIFENEMRQTINARK